MTEVAEGWEQAGDLGDLVKSMLEESDDSARAYLREEWLAAAMATLRASRRRSGLTQQAIADALGTSQPAIARLERSDDTTLGRFWDYLYACGQAPAEIETVPAEGLRRFAAAIPRADRTATAVRRWLRRDTFSTWGPQVEASESIDRYYVFVQALRRWTTEDSYRTLLRSIESLHPPLDRLGFGFRTSGQAHSYPGAATPVDLRAFLAHAERSTPGLEGMIHESSALHQGVVTQRMAA